MDAVAGVATTPVHNPSTGEVIAETPQAGADAVAQAVQAAADALAGLDGDAAG